MKKSDLKTGMWFLHRNGEKRMVLLGTENGDVVAGEESWGSLDAYTEGFKHMHLAEYDIMVIYGANSICKIPQIDESYKIWKREPELVEMTLEEACKKLRDIVGKPVKIIL